MLSDARNSVFPATAFVANAGERTRSARRDPQALMVPTRHLRYVSAIPSPIPQRAEDQVCPVCSSTSLTRGRLSTNKRESIDFVACDDCGDFWFERAGTRLTGTAMRDLGLMP